MKSTIKETDSPPAYPKLRKKKDGTMIVLFNSSTTGMVVHSNDPSDYPVGYHSTSWFEEKFEDFCGTITLEN